MEKTNFNKIFLDLKRLNPFLHQRFPMSNWSKFFKDKKLLSVSTNKNEINWLKIKEFGEKYILSFLNKNFSKSKNKINVLDIGCNDGYLTELIAKKGYKNILGIEPRKESVLRGQKLRSFFKYKPKAKYKICKIENLKSLNKNFDVAICSGVLHHTHNIFENLKIIMKVSKMLIIEGEFIPENLVKNDRLEKQGQLKDIIYDNKLFNTKNNKKLYGVNLEKLETTTSEGSTMEAGFVQIPTISSIKLYSKVLNYDFKLYKTQKFKNQLNSFRSIIILKKRKENKLNDINYIFEKNFLRCIVPIEILDKIKTKKKIDKKFYKKYEIVLNRLKYDLKNKIKFEYAKFYIKNRNKNNAIKLLKEIIIQKRTDWFSAYRTFFIMSFLDKKNKKRWIKITKLCNPKFPLKLLSDKEIKEIYNF